MFKPPLINTTDSQPPTDSGTPPQSPLPTSPAPQLIQQAPPSAHFGSAADRTSAEDSTDSSEAPNGEAFSGANDSLNLLWEAIDADAEGEAFSEANDSLSLLGEAVDADAEGEAFSGANDSLTLLPEAVDADAEGEAFSGANDSLPLLPEAADADAEGEGSGPHWHDEDLQDLLYRSFYDVNTSSLRKVEVLSNALNTFSWSLSICQSNGHENGFDPQRSPGLDADQHPPAPDDVPYGGYHL